MILKCQNPRCEQSLQIADTRGLYNVTCPRCRHIFQVDTRGEEPSEQTASVDYVIYDLETTGLRPDSEEIIQIAAVRFRNGKLIESETFSTFAKPSRPISSFISSYTGITNSHVAKAPSPHEAVWEFSRFVGNARLIAHNGHRFDSKFLDATCRRHNLQSVEIESIDSINLSKQVFGRVRGTGHGLDVVLSRLGISSDGHARHDARGDVALLGRAVEKMWSKLRLDDTCAGIQTHTTSLPKF